MSLMGMREVYWGFGDPPLLESISFQVEKGDRICLLGRNGVGKSTILRLLNHDIEPDQGEIWRQTGVKVALLEQEVPPGFDGTIYDIVAQGVTPDPNANENWELTRQINSALSRTQLDPEKPFADLSAGMKRRTLFARALAKEPDILLLDEPTNHLDIDSIIWMEEFIQRYIKTLVFVTHDRAFVQKMANKIIELDRGSLFAFNCDYPTYLKRRQMDLEAEENQARLFKKKLSVEETWIRQGIKARRTRNEGRVKALKKMREEYQNRRRKTGSANLTIQEADRSGKLVIEAKNIGYSYQDTPFIQNFSTVIMRGDKVGIIGPNGIGKTTLLKILLKTISPHQGTVRHGTNLEVAYFDQLRDLLDENKTVAENIGEGNDFIIFNNQKRHVISHLKNFLFSPERCRTPVHILSGGEKNRLMMAKLFTKPANVLVLDEPTNDLDAETLELLEEMLFEFNGTVLLVSHDRAFLNNVVTSTLVFEKQGQVTEYAGGYDDWLVQRPEIEPAVKSETKPAKQAKPKQTQMPNQIRKLSFNEKRELERLPQQIEALETEQKDIYTRLSDPDLYKKDQEEVLHMKTRAEQIEKEIEFAYTRWEELDNI